MRWDQMGINLEVQFPGRNNNWEKGPEGKILVFLKNSENESQDGPQVPSSGNGIVWDKDGKCQTM